jgi:hypothetical protein
MRDTCGSRAITFTKPSAKSNLVDSILLEGRSNVAAEAAYALPRDVVERQLFWRRGRAASATSPPIDVGRPGLRIDEYLDHRRHAEEHERRKARRS